MKKKSGRFALWLLIFLSLSLWTGKGWAQNPTSRVYIDINAPGGTVVPLALLYKGPASIKQVLVRDLTLYGIFRLINPKAFLIEEFKEGDFEDWRIIGADILVVAQAQEEGDTVGLTARIFDVVEGREVLAKRYSVKKGAERLIAHRLADHIFWAFTGEEGIFSHPMVLPIKKGEGKEVYLMDPDGLWMKQLTSNGSVNLSPTFSPDGKRVALVSFKAGDADIYMLEIKGGKEQLLVGGKGSQSAPAWSPNGRFLAYSSAKRGNTELYILDMLTGKRKRLTYYEGIDTSPAWSPDGEWLAFVSDRSGSPHIFVVSRDGKTLRRLTYGKYDVSPAWSPRGDIIAYSTLENSRFYIHVITPEGTGDRILVEGESPSWAPNGRYLVFYKGFGKGKALFLTSSQGGGSILIKEIEGDRGDWSRKFIVR